ncbi:MAG: hypothetical protein K1W14_14820 [Muribaculaceae bacterium]
MRISDDQLAILNSFSVVRINDRDDFLRQVDDFKNDRNENLVTYIQGDAFDDDKSGNVACYIVTDSDSEILCYFSIRCGTLYSEFEELELFQKHKMLKLELKELSEKAEDSSMHKEILNQKEKQVAEYRRRIENLIGSGGFMTSHKQVAKSYPAVELSHFCINHGYKKKWESYGFGAKNRIGATLFWHIIVSKLNQIRQLVGCEFFYLFAADATPDRHLVNHYINRMDLRDDIEMLTLQPLYDSRCTFLCNRLDDLIVSQYSFFDHFNDTDEI